MRCVSSDILAIYRSIFLQTCVKDVRANCVFASLLRTQIRTSRHARERVLKVIKNEQ